MTISAGTRLGPYEVLSPLGAGGMGEVWRARDGKLGREVAIKVLPEAFAADADRLARFRREAQVLASLNHPHIGAIYGLEESGGVEALVLELVEGETLAERVARGPIPLDEALAIAREIAQALEAAHERGIVHRDLKPANVKLTPQGSVKVLDFGLAKALTGDGSAPDMSHSPTMTAAATQAGVVIGTAAYMSPEQARGRAVDRRADVWAFGAVLYELLAGRRAFDGETVSDTLAAVLTRDPDWSALPAGTPAPVRRVLKRCLERDAKKRLHDIADARLEMDETLEAPATTAPAVPAARRARWPLFAAAVVAAAALGIFFGRGLLAPRPAASPRLTRLKIPEAAFVTFSQVAISPDGRRIAFVKYTETIASPLFVRDLDEFDSKPLAGTEGARNPFFSPDGRSIGYFSSRGLRRVSTDGGTPQALCDAATTAWGGAWGPDDTIVLSGGRLNGKIYPGLLRISASGGIPRPLAAPDAKKGESEYGWPEFLPDGKTVLYTVVVKDGFRVDAVSLATGRTQTVLASGSYARYSPTGHLIFRDGNTVMIAPFDAGRLAATAAPVLFPEQATTGFSGVAAVAISREGTLVYSAGAGLHSNTVVWVDRKGVTKPVFEEPASWAQPRLSPDGRRLAVRKIQTPNCDVWVCDLERSTLTRLTAEGDNHDPLWAPDGKSITFDRHRATPEGILWKPADGSGQAVLLLADNEALPQSWSADGRLLAFTKSRGSTGGDIWVMPAGAPREAKPFLQSEFNEANPTFSPDGHFLAYSSNDSGRDEVYVRPYPGPGGVVQVSTGGGLGPLWSRDGRELFYASGRKMMKVDVADGPDFRARGSEGPQGPPRGPVDLTVSPPQVLFEGAFVWDRPGNYDIAADGKRFIMVRPTSEDTDRSELRVVLHWPEELKRIVFSEQKR